MVDRRTPHQYVADEPGQQAGVRAALLGPAAANLDKCPAICSRLDREQSSAEKRLRRRPLLGPRRGPKFTSTYRGDNARLA